jgi:hypothetical protein
VSQASFVVHWKSCSTQRHFPRKLRSLGKDEKFLENIIAQNPELLGLESRRTGIYGPYVCYQQVSLTTPANRAINPDIVILSASGHLIVVEVKLGDNPELRNRDVIAQIIDYAASFAVLDETQLVGLFEKTIEEPTWNEFIYNKFSGEHDLAELASVMRDRIASGQINIVVACDHIHPVVAEIVRGIAIQQSTSFALDLIEVTPFVTGDASEELIFVPSNRLSTEIVARTTVTVAYQDLRPDVSVETTPLHEVDANKMVATEKTSSRVWAPQEVEKIVRESGNELENRLLDFCKQHSQGGEFVSPAVKSNPAFGFFVIGKKLDGKKTKNMLFWYTHGWGTAYMNCSIVKQFVDEATFVEFQDRLSNCFGNRVEVSAPNPSIRDNVLATTISDFEEIILWIKSRIMERAEETFL